MKTFLLAIKKRLKKFSRGTHSANPNNKRVKQNVVVVVVVIGKINP
jgi:hypothetical protein